MNKLWLILALLALFSLSTQSLQAAGVSLQEYINNHVTDGNKWSILPFDSLTYKLPQFEVGGIVFNNGLHAVMLVLAGLFLIFFFVILYKKDFRKAPKGMTNALEVLVLFVRDEICVNYLGAKDGKKFAPFFLSLFFFILILNLMGLIPVFSTATANINITAGLSLIILGLMIIGGVLRNGVIGFLKCFAPSGVPVPVLFLLFPIELVGMFIKPMALTVRLFANMLAGHLVILSILGTIITFGFVGLPSLFLVLFVYLLEILVAFLQAYIFTMLSAMFLGDMLHPHH